MNRLTMAHDFVVERHGDERRKFTNTSYIVHLEETAQLLWESTDGRASDDEYIAALFHDLLEKTITTPEEIDCNYGREVMRMVMEVTNDLTQLSTEGREIYLSKKINNMSNKAMLIKLCSCLSNVVGLQEDCIPDDFVNKYIKETQYIIEHLNRETDEIQNHLLEKIKCMLIFLKLKRNL
jgi:(p)ppGpp synthase/HD superfamily hydrolase